MGTVLQLRCPFSFLFLWLLAAPPRQARAGRAESRAGNGVAGHLDSAK